MRSWPKGSHVKLANVAMEIYQLPRGKESVNVKRCDQKTKEAGRTKKCLLQKLIYHPSKYNIFSYDIPHNRLSPDLSLSRFSASQWCIYFLTLGTEKIDGDNLLQNIEGFDCWSKKNIFNAIESDTILAGRMIWNQIDCGWMSPVRFLEVIKSMRWIWTSSLRGSLPLAWCVFHCSLIIVCSIFRHVHSWALKWSPLI